MHLGPENPTALLLEKQTDIEYTLRMQLESGHIGDLVDCLGMGRMPIEKQERIQMKIAEKIFREVSKMPDHLAQEVLDFIEYIQKKYDVRDMEIQNLKEAQASVMKSTWDNEEDDIWNEHPSC